jgi:hypothetical protein
VSRTASALHRVPPLFADSHRPSTETEPVRRASSGTAEITTRCQPEPTGRPQIQQCRCAARSRRSSRADAAKSDTAAVAVTIRPTAAVVVCQHNQDIRRYGVLTNLMGRYLPVLDQPNNRQPAEAMVASGCSRRRLCTPEHRPDNGEWRHDQERRNETKMPLTISEGDQEILCIPATTCWSCVGLRCWIRGGDVRREPFPRSSRMRDTEERGKGRQTASCQR